MKRFKNLYLIPIGLVIISCNHSTNQYDASGTFEAVETIISAETNGKIMQLELKEGQELELLQTVGYIDSTQLHMQKLQLEQNKKAILSGKPQTELQTAALKKELTNAKLDRDRLENLVKGGVASQKQLDDANTRVAALKDQISAQESTLNTTTSSINEQGSVIEVQLNEINDKLKKCTIINPIKGIVLSKYAGTYEMTAVGMPLYKIADLSNIIFRAYITGNQLPQVKLNQKVKIFADFGEETREYSGVVQWISSKSEFTPKTIQTKDERANLVYAIKIDVKNDGLLKIGMYGQVLFQK